MTKLRALFILVGSLAIAGTTYQMFLLAPGNTPADAIDAGIVGLTVPARLSCKARVKDSCMATLGIANRYVRLPIKARRSKAASPVDFFAFDLPAGWEACLVPLGCDVIENGTCTDPTICAANYVPVPESDTCACSSGSNCTVGGQPAVLGVTLQPGTFTGSGCVAKYCGPEIFGEQGASWPAGCP